MDKKILARIGVDLQAIKPIDPQTYHRLENDRLKPLAHEIRQERNRVLSRPHPPGCNCPWHKGHPGQEISGAEIQRKLDKDTKRVEMYFDKRFSGLERRIGKSPAMKGIGRRGP